MALRESESLLDDIPDGVLTVDVATETIVSVNETCCTMLHREESALVGLPFAELAADESTPITNEAVGRARKNGPVTVQCRLRTGHGMALPVEARVAATTRGGQELAVLTLRERPQREAPRQPLERGRDRYRTLFDNDDLVLWEQDFSEARAYATELADTGEELGRYLDSHPEELFEILGRMEVHMVNDAALDFYGVESKTELVANFDEMMVPDTREGLTAMWKAVVDGQRYFCTECKFRPLDGDEVRYELMEVYVPEAHADDYSLVFTTATDITEQKRREEELASAKERYRRILDRSSEYVLICDEVGDIEYASPGIEATLGYEPADIEGTDAFEYVHPDDRDDVQDAFETMLADPEASIRVEYRVRRAEDSYLWVEARGGNYLSDPLIGGLMVSIRDIVERKQSEQALLAERDARSALQRELASATSAETFASAVCAELAALDAVAGAQVGILTPIDTVDVLASAGEDAVIGESVALDSDAAVRQDDTRSLAELSADGSVTGDATIPITHEGVTRGLLVVRLTDRATEVEHLRSLLEESADVLGYAMASADRRQALAADEWLQLSVDVQTTETPLSRALETAGTTARVATAVTRPDGTVLCYLDIAAERSAFVEAARARDGIERVDDAGATVQVVVAGPVPSAVVADHGGSVDDATVTGEGTTLQFRVPQGTAFDPILDALTERFGDVATGEFTTAPTETGARDDPFAGLTDRQREVLAVAFGSGYFEKPRARNASEVAAALGVSRTSYDEVLRAAQRNLFTDLFDRDRDR